MIKNIKHKGLRQLYEDDNPRGVNPEHVHKLRQILLVLDAAQAIDDLDVETFGLHRLAGERKGEWSVRVRGNWRVTFKFENGQPIDVDYEDYHKGHY